ncbi:MAG: DUF4292 domain-containing protein [Candidatus Dadabacteria bacterium]|nr:MAG: DUF4292 domain-containing protein [Candidatus Dadabacteria bacterium]
MKKLLFLILLPGSLAGCALKTTIPPGYYPLKSDRAILEEVASLQSRRSSEINSARILALSLIKAEHSSYRTKNIIVFDRTNKLFRYEILPISFGYAAAVMVSGPEGYTYLDSSNKQAITGSDSGKIIKKLLGAKLDVNDLTALLTGRLPLRLIRAVKRADRVYRAYPDKLLIDIYGARYRVILDVAAGEVLSFEVRAGFRKKRVLKISYGSYQAAEQFSYPSYIEIKSYRNNFNQQISIKMAKFNSELPPALFKLPVPAGYTVRSY